MSVAIDIHPLSQSLDMYGGADPSSAYSLSGHVSITLSSTSSLFGERLPPPRILLQSLRITFEGQQELLEGNMGYKPIRLHNATRDIIDRPLELNADEFDDETASWNVVFDLPIPGWLPASSLFGMGDSVGTRYALHATAKYLELENRLDMSWFSMLCSPFRSRTRLIEVEKVIPLHRYTNPPTTPSAESLFAPIRYSPNTLRSETEASDECIPIHIISKLCVETSIPKYTSLQESSIPFSIRLRADLEKEETDRIQVSEFSVNVQQVEVYRNTPSSEYQATFPLPGPSSQPPNQPLIRPMSLHSMYESNLYYSIDSPACATRTFSILPSGNNGIFANTSEDHRIFTTTSESEPEEGRPWYSFTSSVPIQTGTFHREPCLNDGAGELVLRPSAPSPFFNISHEMHISLACSYDLPEGRKSRSRVSFIVPVHFVRVTPPPSTQPVLSPHAYSTLYSLQTGTSSSCLLENAPLLSPELVLCPSSPYAPTLPAYSQLYDSNGDRKIDYSVDLPLYSPRVATGSLEVKED